MKNLEQYKNLFISHFGVEESVLDGLKYQDIETWDSVGHMGLMALIESTFDIMMEPDDIINFSSFEKGKTILSTNYQIDFDN